MLGLGLGAMISGCAFQFGMPYLIPALRAEGLSLGEASLLVTCPMAGLLFTLIGWGVLADRRGERFVLGLGLGLAALFLAAAAAVDGTLPKGACLVLAGAAGASVHAASGRLILGWFAPTERGLAMAIRQSAQPLGVAVGAAALPPLGAGGTGRALLALAGCCAVMGLLAGLFVHDPPPGPARAGERTSSPYRTPVLWRLHTSAAFLVVPQFAVATFALVYLVDARDWDPAPAGRLLAAVAVAGALARLGAGLWSDRVGSRLRPYRTLAVLIGAIMAALALGAATGSPAAVAALLVAGVLTVSPNGLGTTAVAEYAGLSWAGRALGIQNTFQNVLSTATPPLLGGLIGATDYATAFAVAVAFPLLAVALIPMHAEHAP
ncbi:MFS transporter [Actinomadura craniellae]|uniref:MFS transporter n=2 Tax=Actinomadura craniellae TaxID=2231787 RepID=A0A365GYB2_9ACTN|nr:MFS transporter [Actinomadura craniellae]